jgi:hypothetical protein
MLSAAVRDSSQHSFFRRLRELQPILSREDTCRLQDECVTRALRTNSIIVFPAKGFSSKPSAPPACARLRIVGSGNAVMKMIGMRLPCAISRSRRSIPLIPGICTSVIRQELSSTRGERRNSSADSNTKATKPSDPRRLCIAARTDASSSTIETIGVFDTRAILLLGAQTRQRVERRTA